MAGKLHHAVRNQGALFGSSSSSDEAPVAPKKVDAWRERARAHRHLPNLQRLKRSVRHNSHSIMIMSLITLIPCPQPPEPEQRQLLLLLLLLCYRSCVAAATLMVTTPTRSYCCYAVPTSAAAFTREWFHVVVVDLSNKNSSPRMRHDLN